MVLTGKYHARPTLVDGIRFDSRKEAARYRELRLLERAGEIQGLQLQVPFLLLPKSQYGRPVKYIADFVYIQGGRQVVEDAKGYRTDVYKLKRRLMAELLGIEIKEM